jgi:hypothetical protein
MRRALLSGGESRSRIHADRVARPSSLIRVFPDQNLSLTIFLFPLDSSAREVGGIGTCVPKTSRILRVLEAKVGAKNEGVGTVGKLDSTTHCFLVT